MKCNRKVYAISTELLQEIMTEGWDARNIRCIEGLPPDARFVCGAAIYDREVWFVFDHPSFPENDTNWTTAAYPRVAARYQRDYGIAPLGVSTEGAAWAAEAPPFPQCSCIGQGGKVPHDPHCPQSPDYWKQRGML